MVKEFFYQTLSEQLQITVFAAVHFQQQAVDNAPNLTYTVQ